MSSGSEPKKRVNVFHEGSWNKGFVSDETERHGILLHEVTFENDKKKLWLDFKRDKVIKINGFAIESFQIEETDVEPFQPTSENADENNSGDETTANMDISDGKNISVDDGRDGVAGSSGGVTTPLSDSLGPAPTRMVARPAPRWDENIVISILDPSVYTELDLKGLPWCRYCGARETSGWSRGPWGSRNLCIPHYVAWWQKKTLDLSPHAGTLPQQPINPSENTEFKYKAWKIEQERKRERQTLASKSLKATVQETVDELEYSRFQAKEEEAAAKCGRRISSRAIRVKFIKLQEEKRDEERKKALDKKEQAEANARKEREKLLAKQKMEERAYQAALQQQKINEKKLRYKERENALLEKAKQKQKIAAEKQKMALARKKEQDNLALLKKRARESAAEDSKMKRTKTQEKQAMKTKVAWKVSDTMQPTANGGGLFSWTTPLPMETNLATQESQSRSSDGDSTNSAPRQFVWTRPRRG